MRFGIATLMVALLCPQMSFAQGGTVYAFDVRTRDNFLVFPAEDPTNLTFLDKNIAPFAMDFNNDGTTLYAVDSNTDQVGTMDPATGAFTFGAMLNGDFAGGTVTGMSFDPTSALVYICTATDLYTLDVDTGATVLLGQFANSDGLLPPPGTVIEIAIDNSGQMFLHELDPDNANLIVEGGLWSVDKTNAVSTFISTSGIEAVFAQGMDFDPDTDILYASIYSGGGTGSYGTWDTTTGVFTAIETLPNFGAVELEVAINNGVTHAFDFRGSPDSFFNFPVDNPLPVTSEEPIFNYLSFAMDFDDAGNLYLYENVANTFGIVDKKTGCFTPTAALSGDVASDPEGMAFDASTGMFWLVDANMLYMVDPDTGVSTLVSTLSDGGFAPALAIDIAIDNDGNMYVFDIGDDFNFDMLYSVEPASGVLTAVGAPGIAGDAAFAQGMDFDPVSNTLYQAIYTGGGTGSYGSWDLGTGTFTEILALPSFLDPIGTGYELEMAIDGSVDVLIGDVNCDGEVNILDVAPFVDLITSGGFSVKADINGDGSVDILDVAPFVELLTGG